MNDVGAGIGFSAIDLADAPDFDLGDLRVRPALRSVEMAGETRHLEPKVMQVLVALAAARPRVVARDRLIEQCWGGRIVGDDALNRCILALRRLARSFDPPPFSIETTPRVGHRLIERPPLSTTATVTAPPVQRTLWTILVLVVLAAACVAAVLLLRANRAAGPASIAVLPFRNLSAGDPYFAEGVGEEILDRLSREPRFRVVGRNSAAKFRDADLRDAGRALGVDYILEGSVQSRGDRVRVSAALAQTSDGMRLWSGSYDRDLDDIFAIQSEIGASVADSLDRQILRRAPLRGPLVTDGETYQLYLNARGMLRARDPRLAQTAVEMLRQAIRRDPGYAPAWSSLAQALRLRANAGGAEDVIAATVEGERYARHALRLAPDLAEAHGVLGMLLGFASPEAQYHIRRAAALDPNNAEQLFWLGNSEADSGRFARALQTYARAVRLDPLWLRPVEAITEDYAEMGRREKAEAIAASSLANDPAARHMTLAQIAWISGDISEAARHLSIVAKSDSAFNQYARLRLGDAAVALGRSPPPSGGDRVDGIEQIAMKAAPSPGVWQARNRSAAAAEVWEYHNIMAAKLMLGAGRVPELLAAYDRPVGLFGFHPGKALPVNHLRAAPVVALALRRGGRAAEAGRLLARADATIRAIYARGPVPFWFDADAAAIAATQGRADQALTMLERAVARGWTHRSAPDDLPGLADEPAFASLRGLPRFKAIEARLAAWREREKRETATLEIF